METYDPQGSIVESSLDNDSLGSQGEYAKSVFVYDGFGGLRSSESTSGSSPARHKDPVGFGGEWGYYQDLQTGLEHLGARYYDGGTGRFVTRDPIGYGGGENLYAFCGNNPITGSDPEGTSKDPMPTDDSNWVRLSIALFIPMKEFISLQPLQGEYVTHKGDGRSYNYNTDADRVRVDFALNTSTGALVRYPVHTAGSQMTLWNNYVEHATATLESSVKSIKRRGGWLVTVSGGGWDPFYDAGNIHLSPEASFSATMFIKKGGSVHGGVSDLSPII